MKNTAAVLERREKSRFGVLLLADALVSLADIASLAMLLLIVRFYAEQPQEKVFHFLPGWLAGKQSIGLISVFLLLFALKNFAAYRASTAWYRFIGDVAIRISRNSLSNFQHSSYEHYVHADSSTLIRKISLRPFEFAQYILTGIQQLITQSILIGLAITAIIIFDTKLFLLLLLVLLPPVAAVFYLLRRKLNKAQSEIKTRNEQSYRHLLDALKGYVESNVFDRNEFFLSRFIDSRSKFSKALFESISIQNLPPRIIEVFAVLGLFILITIATWSTGDGPAMWITIGAFMAAAYKIIPGLVKIINVTGQMRAYGFSASDMAESTGRATTAAAADPSKRIRSIRFENISFGFGSQSLLDNLSFDLQPGDIVGISGKSGRGKTTLLNILLGFLEPSGGRLLINGQRQENGSIRQWWPKISYVRQQNFLIHDTILRNITLAEEDIDEDRLQRALRFSGLNEFLAGEAEGPAKLIVENGKNISGGQQQRIAIARAFYIDADLLILDEPFNELDEPSVRPILDYLRILAQAGRMVILVTHDPKTLTICNKIISPDEQETKDSYRSYSRVSQA